MESYLEEIKMLKQELTTTQTLLDEAVKVIEFYADHEYWQATQGDDQSYVNDRPPMRSCVFVQGKRARNFLSKLKAAEGKNA